MTEHEQRAARFRAGLLLEEAGGIPSDKTPPWTLFLDKGEPLAILPAGRPGDVCTTEGWTLEQAQRVVAAVNAAWGEP